MPHVTPLLAGHAAGFLDHGMPHDWSGGAVEAQRPAAEAEQFETLVGELRPDLYRYALWLSRDPTLAEDVVQEALIRAWRSLRNLRDLGAVKQWLLTIVRRECARHYERKRLDIVDIDDLCAAEAPLATAEDPDLAAMRQAIFGLEPAYREPLVLQVLMGYSVAEVAKLMDITTGAVLIRLFRARKKLAASFCTAS
jgi:RNA polymerase sigma-70 factor (ECF subfamily)